MTMKDQLAKLKDFIINGCSARDEDKHDALSILDTIAQAGDGVAIKPKAKDALDYAILKSVTETNYPWIDGQSRIVPDWKLQALITAATSPKQDDIAEVVENIQWARNCLNAALFGKFGKDEQIRQFLDKVLALLEKNRVGG